jgi:hypothetical protein
MDMLSARQLAQGGDGPPRYIAQSDECEIFELAWRSQLPLLIKGPTEKPGLSSTWPPSWGAP